MAYLIADGLILAVLLLFALVGAPGVHPVPVRSAGRAGAFVGASFAARTLSP